MLTISDKAIEELVAIAREDVLLEIVDCICVDEEGPYAASTDAREAVVDFLRRQKQHYNAFRTDLTPSPIEAQRAVEEQKKLGY